MVINFVSDVEKKTAIVIQRIYPDIVENVAVDDVILPLFAAEVLTFDEKQDIEAKQGGDTSKVILS